MRADGVIASSKTGRQMNIFESTAAYERWLRKRLGGDVVKKDLAEKHRKMAADPFKFLRATYWRWAEVIFSACPELRDAPPVLAVGDIHLENFGSWRDREGRLVWGVNDYDEAAEMPYPLDLVRLATSAVLAHPERRAAGAMCAFILDGYRRGLVRPEPFVLDHDYEWLRRKVVVPETQRQRFWDKIAVASENREEKSVPRRYAKALAAALPDADIPLTYSPRSAGTGSLGRARWVAYGTWLGGPVVREAKAVVQSAWTRVHGGARRSRSAEIASGRYRAPDPWYALDGAILVRRLSPNNHKIEVPSNRAERRSEGFLRKADFVDGRILAAMGQELAAIHLGTANRRKAISADLAARAEDWLMQATLRAAGVVRDEHRQWKTAFRASERSG